MSKKFTRATFLPLMVCLPHTLVAKLLRTVVLICNFLALINSASLNPRKGPPSILFLTQHFLLFNFKISPISYMRNRPKFSLLVQSSKVTSLFLGKALPPIVYKWAIIFPRHKWNFYLKINFKIQTCLFTIARFSTSESLRVYPNIYKNSLPFASSKGFPLVGFAMSVRERESASDNIIIITI